MHIENAIKKLNGNFTKLYKLVETHYRKTMESLLMKDPKTAKQLIKVEKKVNIQEIEIEEECLKILALYQPVAKDLRHIIAILKINNDMERISDLCNNINGRTATFEKKNIPEKLYNIPKMIPILSKIFENTFIAFWEKEADVAIQVCQDDQKIDILHSNMYSIVGKELLLYPEQAENLLSVIAISRFIERIADHCTNIAEDVLYIIDGRIHRHRKYS